MKPLAISDALNKEIINWRRDLHKIPEVGLDLPKTRNLLKKELNDIGMTIDFDKDCSGFTSTIKSKVQTNKTIALRFDMDGLPITEETDLSFSSQHTGRMHACGHDAHMAVGLGVVKYLKNNENNLKTNVKFIFQPGEESPGGAEVMIKNGVLRDVDRIVGFHIGIFDYLKTGQIGISYEPSMASLDRFLIEIKGKGSHGGMPHAAIDPILISASIIQEIQSLISRELSPTNAGVISLGMINGGTSYNIIPEKVKLEGTARFIDEHDRQRISSRMDILINKIVEGKGGKVNFNYIFGYPPVVNDTKFTLKFEKIARRIIGKENVINISKPTMAGEDMSYFLKEVPGTYFFLGGLKEHQHHNPKFDIDENSLKTAANILINIVDQWDDEV